MTITMKANLTLGELKAFGKTISVSCVVRNEVNKWRKKHEVVYSIPDEKPIQPRTFPKGTWAVGKPDARDGNPYLEPFFIPTSAWQYLPIWELDNNKCYVKASANMTKDKGYGLHYSTSGSTQGCIRISKKADLLWLVGQLRDHQANGDVIMLEVV
jgi:hypothetical protein